MTRHRLRTAVIAVAAVGTAALAAQPAAAGGGSFRVSFDPPLTRDVAQSNPDSPKTTVRVNVQALRPNGRPVRDAVIDLTLTAPKPSPLLRTDVPRIEGRQLIHTRFAAPDGRYTFSYVFPIRGRYRLDLRAAPVPGSRAAFAPFSAAQPFTLKERSGELTKLILVAAGLLLFGALSAAVLARSHHLAAARRGATGAGARDAEVASPALAVAVLVLLVGGFVTFLVVDEVRDLRADDRVAGYQGRGVGETRSARSGPVVLRYHTSRSTRDGIGVQTLVRTRGSVIDARTGRPIDGAAIAIAALDLETHKPAFATAAPAAGGSFEWDQSYWDGVGYDVRVTAAPGASGPAFAPVARNVHLAVQSMSPPLGAKLLGLLYLLAPLLAGIGLGLRSARWRWGPARRRALPERAVAASG
jgi:hypothetical protein